MSALFGYSKLPTLRKKLRERFDACGGKRRILLLPSLSNRDVLLDMLSTGDVYFGNTPEILSWTDLYDLLVLPQLRRRLLDPHDQRLILRYILKRNIAAMDDRKVQIPQGVRRRGFVDVLSAALHELLLEDVSPDRLLRTEERSEETGVSLCPCEILFGLYTDYLAYLEENNLADSAQIPSLCRKGILESERFPVKLKEAVFYWVGFLSFTGAQLKLVKLLECSGAHMEFFVPETGLDRFYDVARQLKTEKSPLEKWGGNFLSLAAVDSYEQFDRVAKMIALANAGEGELGHYVGAESSDGMGKIEIPDDVGIMLAPDKLPAMESALRKYGVPFQVYSERSLSHSRPIGLIRRAWNAYLADWPSRWTRYLLTDPMLEMKDFDFYGVEREIPEGFASWQKFLHDDEKCARTFERLFAFCKFLDDPEGHTADELFHSLLNLIGGDWERAVSIAVTDEADLDRLAKEASSFTVELGQKIDSLDGMSSHLGEAAEIRFSGDEAMTFILDWSENTHMPLPPPRYGAVTLYDSPPPMLFSHRIWVMTDVDSSRFPGASSDHVLLNEGFRERMNERFPDEADENEGVHLPTLHEVRQQKEALFRRLLAVGNDVTVISYSSSDSQGRPQSPSSFLSSVLKGTSGELGETFGERISVSSGEFATVGHTPQGDASLFPRIARSTARTKLHVRLSSIDAWNDCPFLWWCQNIACLEPPGENKGLLDRRLRGTLMHELWQDIWNRYLKKEPGCDSLFSALVSKWGEMIASLSEKIPNIGDPRFLAVLNNLKNDMSLAAERQDDVETRAKSAGLKREKTLMEYSLPVYEGKNAIFSGRADRIDLWREFGAVIIDYKLGDSDRYKDSLQLAAYANLLRRGGAFPVAGFCYVGHKGAKLRGAWNDRAQAVYRAPEVRSSWDLAEKMEEATRLLEMMDEAIGLGAYPAEYRSERCRDCPYSTLCRRSECSGESRTSEKDEETDDVYG